MQSSVICAQNPPGEPQRVGFAAGRLVPAHTPLAECRLYMFLLGDFSIMKGFFHTGLNKRETLMLKTD